MAEHGARLAAFALVFFLVVAGATPASAQTIVTFAGNGTQASAGDGGSAIAAALDHPRGIGQDPAGNIYVADFDGNRIRRVDLGGTIITIAGTGTPTIGGDGGPAGSASLNQPEDVKVDQAGNIYIADAQNRRIRKITPNGVISTFAGTGTEGFSGDGGPATAAMLGRPVALAIDRTGAVFFVDSTVHRVRVVTPDGTIRTVAGNGAPGFSGDGGPATSASLNFPNGLALDNSGNIYIADSENHRIRRVSPNGIITTVAGNGIAGFSGDGGSATAGALNYPYDVAVSFDGSLIITDSGNNRVRRVANGVINTIAGNGIDAYSGDGGAAASASLSFPWAVTVDFNGNILIADRVNNRVREILGPSMGAPVLPPASIVNAGSFANPSASNGAVAPGSVISIFGDNFTASLAQAGILPLPALLNGVSVKFNGIAAPLFFVSQRQINAQLPTGLPAGAVTVQVTRLGVISSTQTVNVAAAGPGIFTMNQQGTGDGALLHSDFKLVGSANAAARGEVVSLFLTGLGATNPAVAAGVGAPSSPLAQTIATPVVTVGGVPATVSFSGLAPGFAGLYQVNFQVPTGVAVGAQTLALTMNGIAGNNVVLWVR